MGLLSWFAEHQKQQDDRKQMRQREELEIEALKTLALEAKLQTVNAANELADKKRKLRKK